MTSTTNSRNPTTSIPPLSQKVRPTSVCGRHTSQRRPKDTCATRSSRWISWTHPAHLPPPILARSVVGCLPNAPFPRKGGCSRPNANVGFVARSVQEYEQNTLKVSSVNWSGWLLIVLNIPADSCCLDIEILPRSRLWADSCDPPAK